MSSVIDLDVLRPKRRIVKLGGKEIDVSFLPVAITFDVAEILNQAGKLDAKKAAAGGTEGRKGLDLTIKLCATFCSWKHPDLDEQWFRENTTAEQITMLTEEIKAALGRSYKGVDESKNGEAAEAD